MQVQGSLSTFLVPFFQTNIIIHVLCPNRWRPKKQRDDRDGPNQRPHAPVPKGRSFAELGYLQDRSSWADPVMLDSLVGLVGLRSPG